MASWVEAGPGSRFVAAMASSNSPADNQALWLTHNLRSRDMCAGGPPKPVQPIRPHSAAIVLRRTGAGSSPMVGPAP